MKALLFTGGGNPDLKKAASFLRGYDCIAAADSGVATARGLGLTPDLIVGDMDSVPSGDVFSMYAGSEIITLDTAKDDSDTESALKVLHRRNFSDVTLVGGGGGRLDHLFSIERLFLTDARPSVWLAGESAVVFVGSAGRLEKPGVRETLLRADGLEPGDTVSVFPIGRGRHRIEAENLRWGLDIPWDDGAYSLSNWAEARSVSVRCIEGAFLCVFPLKESLSLFRPPRARF